MQEQVVILRQQEGHELLRQVILHDLTLSVDLGQLIIPGLRSWINFAARARGGVMKVRHRTASTGICIWIKARNHHGADVIVGVMIIASGRLKVDMCLFQQLNEHVIDSIVQIFNRILLGIGHFVLLWGHAMEHIDESNRAAQAL